MKSYFELEACLLNTWAYFLSYILDAFSLRLNTIMLIGFPHYLFILVKIYPHY